MKRWMMVLALVGLPSPKTFAAVELVRPPLSWEQALRQREFALYATSVHGALLHYDWTDLLK